jgi:hypothetical protein
MLCAYKEDNHYVDRAERLDENKSCLRLMYTSCILSASQYDRAHQSIFFVPLLSILYLLPMPSKAALTAKLAE